MRRTTTFPALILVLCLVLWPDATRSLATDQGPWQISPGNGVTSALSGSRGILVSDWDGDGKTEVLVAHDALFIALEHDGDYEFAQSGPPR